MKRLIIAEKPSVARAIAESLGIVKSDKGYIECNNDTVVTWCFGHMFELAEPDQYTPDSVPLSSKGSKLWRFDELPILPSFWKLKESEKCKDQIKVIKGLLKKAQDVVNAGDPDREGQLLVDELLEELKYSGKVLRYWSNAIDKKSVERALNNLKDNADYVGLRDSAKGRSRADWLVGMNITRALTLANHGLITVGRVQTPTVKLVYDRDQKIKNFKPVDYFNVLAKFKAKNGEYEAKLQSEFLIKGIDEENRLIDKSYTEEILKSIQSSSGVIERVKKETKKVKQPLGLSLADLTSLCSSKLGLSAKETLDIAQSLYEKKYTSYPRTDCKYLPESQYSESNEVLEAIKKVNPELTEIINNSDSSIHSAAWNTEKTTAHHAIIPTSSDNLSQLKDKEAQVYELVARNYIAQFYPEYEFLSTEIITSVNEFKFKTKGKVVLIQGFKAVYNDSDEDKREDKDDKVIDVSEHEEVLTVNSKLDSAKTKAPSRFTEGALIKAMENIYKYIDEEEYKKDLKDGDGIGTSATRASIIEEIKKRGYIATKGKYLESTEYAESLLNKAPAQTQSAIMTAIYERQLSEIENRKLDLDSFIKTVEDYIKQEVEYAKNNISEVKVDYIENTVCPVCGKSIKNSKYSYMCSECDFKCSKEILSAKISESDFKKIIEEQSPVFSFTSLKTKKKFKAKLKYDKLNNKFIFEMQNEGSEYTCPECGKALYKRESQKKKGVFYWSCSGYKDGCNKIFYDNNGKPKF